MWAICERPNEFFMQKPKEWKHERYIKETSWSPRTRQEYASFFQMPITTLITTIIINTK
jgi:hypothetical protein